jgi:hypothetical protein
MSANDRKDSIPSSGKSTAVIEKEEVAPREAQIPTVIYPLQRPGAPGLSASSKSSEAQSLEGLESRLQPVSRGEHERASIVEKSGRLKPGLQTLDGSPAVSFP